MNKSKSMKTFNSGT